MSDILIKYKVKPGMYSKFRNKLFGRLIVNKKRNCYYSPGFLHEIPFCKNKNGMIILRVPDNMDLGFSEIMLFCSKFEVSSINSTETFKSGKERMRELAIKRGYKIGW